jgi:hypothetical protein
VESVNFKPFLFIVHSNYFKMKKIILLFTLAATLTTALRAQCPTQIQDQSGDGSAYNLTLTSAAQCPANGTIFTFNSVSYSVNDCGDLTGNGTPILLQLIPSGGGRVVLATAAPVSFTFGITTCTYNALGFPSALPIELIDFKGTPSVSGNVLTWTTASEVSNKGFQVERAPQPPKGALSTWEVLSFVDAKSKAATYEFTDKAPFGGWGLYRLRQMDNDGKETLSKVISIATKSNGKGLKIYPTLVSNVLTVDYTEGGLFQVINLLGQQVLVGKTTQQLDVSALPQGSYLLKVGTEVAKFVKQ